MRNPAQLALEAEMIALFGGVCEQLGLPKSFGTIFGVVYAAKNPMSFSEIAERVPLSSGSVSQGLRALLRLGALRKLKENGRGDVYVPEISIRIVISELLETRVFSQLEAAKDRLRSIESKLTDLPIEDRKLLQIRVNALVEWHKKLSRLAPWVRRVVRRRD